MIKKIVFAALAAQVVLLTSGFANFAKAEDLNLISNPSAESASITNPNSPLSWSSGKWGVNQASFEYKGDGYDGTHSLYVNMMSYTSGDAKWYFQDVSVNPNTQYTFSDYYKATVPTDIDIQYADSVGNLSYKWLGQMPASSDWKNASFSFTTPSGVQKLTIFHSISAVGNLQTDNFSLTKAGSVISPPPVISGAIPNSSLEQSNNGAPVDWHQDTWSNNKATFTYLNEGHTGSHSAKVEVTSYTDGDSKWYYTPQPVLANTYYQFSDFYKSNIDTEVDLEIAKSDGSTDYMTIGRAALSPTNWSNFTAYFTTPALAKTITVLHVIMGVGYLSVDDYSLSTIAPVSQSFNRGLVSLTFDDGWGSIYSNGFPITQKYQMPGTLYLVTDYLNTPNHMTAAQVKLMQQAGFEVGSHTIDHPHLTTLTSSQVDKELSQSKQILENQFGPVTSIASPFGEYNSQVVSQIKQYYNSHRTTDSGFNTKNGFDQYAIKAETITKTTTASQIQSWLNDAYNNKTWLVLTFHQIDNTGDTYSIPQVTLDNYLGLVKNSGLPAVTIDQALGELLPQL